MLGGIIKGDPDIKKLSLVFTGHEFADGGEKILASLKGNNVKGSFFLTGDFYRLYPFITKQLKENGHYMGPHSDKHLLYADWVKRDSTLVTRDEFCADLQGNYKAMARVGLRLDSPNYFLPSYEWYNQDISNWAKGMNVQIVNFTPGTTSNADYTTPDMKNYRSSEQIYNSILSYEEKESLNGFIILIHIGTHPDRTDKLYNKLDELIKELKSIGYQLVRIDELLQ
ncbi:MAG: polysaccharide deacetylase family protein [Candidatus Saccharimonadaceae bacterium]